MAREIKTLFAGTGSLSAYVAVTAPTGAGAGDFRITQIHMVNPASSTTTFFLVGWGTTWPGGQYLLPLTTLQPKTWKTVNVTIPMVDGDTVEVTQGPGDTAILIVGDELV